jgi:hypothetical protein
VTSSQVASAGDDGVHRDNAAGASINGTNGGLSVDRGGPAAQLATATSAAGPLSSGDDDDGRWHDVMHRAIMDSLQPPGSKHPTWWGSRFHSLQARAGADFGGRSVGMHREAAAACAIQPRTLILHGAPLFPLAPPLSTSSPHPHPLAR